MGDLDRIQVYNCAIMEDWRKRPRRSCPGPVYLDPSDSEITDVVYMPKDKKVLFRLKSGVRYYFVGTLEKLKDLTSIAKKFEMRTDDRKRPDLDPFPTRLEISVLGWVSGVPVFGARAIRGCGHSVMSMGAACCSGECEYAHFDSWIAEWACTASKETRENTPKEEQMRRRRYPVSVDVLSQCEITDADDKPVGMLVEMRTMGGAEPPTYDWVLMRGLDRDGVRANVAKAATEANPTRGLFEGTAFGAAQTFESPIAALFGGQDQAGVAMSSVADHVNSTDARYTWSYLYQWGETARLAKCNKGKIPVLIVDTESGFGVAEEGFVDVKDKRVVIEFVTKAETTHKLHGQCVVGACDTDNPYLSVFYVLTGTGKKSPCYYYQGSRDELTLLVRNSRPLRVSLHASEGSARDITTAGPKPEEKPPEDLKKCAKCGCEILIATPDNVEEFEHATPALIINHYDNTEIISLCACCAGDAAKTIGLWRCVDGRFLRPREEDMPDKAPPEPTTEEEGTHAYEYTVYFEDGHKVNGREQAYSAKDLHDYVVAKWKGMSASVEPVT